MSKAWKELESEVAAFFGGTRVQRHQFQSVEDVVHPSLVLECKYGGQIPGYMVAREPTVINTDDGKKYIVCPSDMLNATRLTPSTLALIPVHRKNVKFIVQGLDQARGYQPDKFPVLCVKPRYCHGFIACWEERRGI